MEKYLNSGFDLYEDVRVKLLECLIALHLAPKDRLRALSIAWKCFCTRTTKTRTIPRLQLYSLSLRMEDNLRIKDF